MSCYSDISEPHTPHEPRCGRPLCMTLSVVQVKQNVSEAGSGFSNRESVFPRNIAGCVYILVATPKDGRKGGLVKFCASAVHQTVDEVETECVFEEKKKSISRLYRVAVGFQYPVRFFSFGLCCTPRSINRLTPKDPYMGRTAPLTSKHCILYIYSKNIGTEYFKHALYSPFFFSSKCSLFHNANLFGSCIIHILYTGCAKIKKNNSGAKGLSDFALSTWHTILKHRCPLPCA